MPNRPLLRAAFYAAMIAGTAWIAAGAVGYFDPLRIHPFVLEKLPLPAEKVWLAALYVHVAVALVCLPACLALLSDGLRRRSPRLHRIGGRVTGGLVLVALVPTGAYLAFFATGGLPSTLGFLLSGAIVFVAMVRAIATARRREFRAHKRWVWHVVAQMSVAVTSRAMLVGAGLLGLDPHSTYVASLWLPVVGSALVVERLARPARPLAPPTGDRMKSFARTAAALFAVACFALPASASPPAQTTAQSPALSLIDAGLLRPLAASEAEQSRFSRARRPPAERRAILTDTSATIDARGRAYRTFAVELRYSRKKSADWETDMKGCVYIDDGSVFIERGSKYASGRVMLGERAPAPPEGVCAPARVAARKT